MNNISLNEQQAEYKDTAKEVLEVCKSLYQSELDRGKIADNKISALLTVSGAIIAVFNYLFTPEKLNYQFFIFDKIMMVLNILIILSLFSVFILLTLGLISRKMETIDICPMAEPKFILMPVQQAIYTLISTYESVIKSNKKIIDAKHNFFKVACIILCVSFGLISIKIVLNIFVQ